MNIKQAKQQIQNAMTVYFAKDRFGYYAMPPEKQRPVFLMGPPGIGKTAVMEQVARELDVGLVAYSMTHHTRQSALGLPYIVEKAYDGQTVQVSEYTMSEIIASVYDSMKATGKREGILFLDEINCVSETLTPAMLQFLQYKTFGRHSIPSGWIVVAAGNPPEYNNAAREFDIVTWDRLKRVDIEPDYDVWKEYACGGGVHGAVTTYLDCKKEDFYSVQSTVDGKRFVTARGWSDLSDMILQYERHGIPVDEDLIRQYLQNPEIAKNFAIYYDLYRKYRTDYQVDAILTGQEPESIRRRAREARFDERVSLLGLLLDAVSQSAGEAMETEAVLEIVLDVLRQVRVSLRRPGAEPGEVLTEHIRRLEDSASQLEGAAGGTSARGYQLRGAAELLHTYGALPAVREGGRAAFDTWRKDFEIRTDALQRSAEEIGRHLECLFRFCETVFPSGQELLILTAELTIRPQTAKFIARYGCEAYDRINRKMQFHERGQKLLKEVKDLRLEPLD